MGAIAATGRRDSASVSPTPGDAFSLAKGDEEERAQADAHGQHEGAGEQVSAADYDPSQDRREDEHKRVWGNGNTAKEEPVDVEMVEEEEVEEVEEDEDDVDDMFAIATTEKKKVKKVKRVVVSLTSSLYWVLNVDEWAEASSASTHHRNPRHRGGSRRILPSYPRRAARWGSVPSVLVAWEGYVRECRACACASGRRERDRQGGRDQDCAVPGVDVSICVASLSVY